jgi:hypothetical protein
MIGGRSKGPCRSAPVGSSPSSALVARWLLAPRFSVGMAKPTIQPESRRDGAHAPRLPTCLPEEGKKNKAGTTPASVKLLLPPWQSRGISSPFRPCGRVFAGFAEQWGAAACSAPEGTAGCPRSGHPTDRSSSVGWRSRFWDLGKHKLNPQKSRTERPNRWEEESP